MRRVHAESVHHLGIRSTPYGQEFVQERDSGGGEGTNRITCYTKGPYVNKYNGMHALYNTKEASFPHRALREAHKIITTRHKAQGPSDAGGRPTIFGEIWKQGVVEERGVSKSGPVRDAIPDYKLHLLQHIHTVCTWLCGKKT